MRRPIEDTNSLLTLSTLFCITILLHSFFIYILFFLISLPPPLSFFFFFFNDTATTEIYTLSLHDALPIYRAGSLVPRECRARGRGCRTVGLPGPLLPAAGGAGSEGAAPVPARGSGVARAARAGSGVARAAAGHQREARRARRSERPLPAGRPQDRELRHRRALGRPRVRAGTRSGARRRAARVRVHRHFDQSGARHRGVSGLVRGRPAQEGRVPPVPHHRSPAGRLRGGARGGDAVPGAAHRRSEAAPGPDGDRRGQGAARRRPRRGACARPGDPAHREPRETRGRSVPAGAVRAAAAVAPQPVAQAAAARPRRGASLRGDVAPQAARAADYHLRAAGDSRDRAEPAPGAAGAVRLAGGRENRDAGRDRRGARLLDDPGGADPRPVEGSGVSLPWSLQCSACGKTRSADGLPTVCECGGPYLVRYTAAPGPEAKSLLRERRWTMWRYREWLPLADGEAPATLGEGGTPLLAVPRLAARYGLPGLRVKDEATNPTGSFKARGLAAAVTRAGHAGARAFVVPTAGNAGVALAAYAARAGVPARVYAPASTPPTILSQIRSYGGDLVLLDGPNGASRAAARADPPPARARG